MHKPFSGLVAAPFTPFYLDHRLNLNAIEPYALFLQNRGVAAAFVCGTTGEGASLTLEERFALAEHWVKNTTAEFRVIVHVGHTCLEDACSLARHAASTGAAAVSCLAPYFFRPTGVNDLVNWCEKIAAAAAPLPFYFYHIPSMTGVHLPMEEFLVQAAGRIPTLAGIKYTHEDLADYARCVKVQAGSFDILFGRDELLLEGLANGAQGAIGSTYNYASPLYIRLIDAHARGAAAEARLLQEKAIRMIQICSGLEVTHLAASKPIMGMLGLDCGPVRLPLRNPSPLQIATLRGNLEEMGFFDLLDQKPILNP